MSACCQLAFLCVIQGVYAPVAFEFASVIEGMYAPPHARQEENAAVTPYIGDAAEKDKVGSSRGELSSPNSPCSGYCRERVSARCW